MLTLLDYMGDDAISTGIVVIVAILLRVLTGLSSYSGAGDPPKFGDYEAQRHWMELTVNLPVREWYHDSPVNNASYWPLDYPPLSGYQSWVCGVALRAVEPEAVQLVSSHGYETPTSKIVMRWTVIVSDLLVYIPACIAAVHAFYGSPASNPATQGTTGRSTAITAAHRTRLRARNLALFALLFNPAAVLIDHGHFQYNNISLGLTLAAVAAIASGRQLLGAAFFSAALNHKQMSLFFAPAFFAHLLGWALHDPAHRSLGAKVLAVSKLGIVVIATFALCWAPYLHSIQSVTQVLIRIFPVRRGLYEDYVANWWCTTSLFIKWKSRFSGPTLLRAAAATTLTVAAPAMAHQILGAGSGAGDDRGSRKGADSSGPSRWGLLLCMANSAFSFYMFSYQVHEKSILLPLLPVTLMAGTEPTLAFWLPLLASFSMFPLLVRDGVGLPYAALVLLYGIIMAGPAITQAYGLQDDARPVEHAFVSKMLGSLNRWALAHWKALLLATVMGGVGLHVARLLVPPPERLPWLHDRAFITFAFAGFAPAFIYLQISQWLREPVGAKRAGKPGGKLE